MRSIVDSAPAPAGPWLVGDIGGTNARFGWVDAPGGAVAHVRRIAVADHAGPGAAARAYLGALALARGAAPPPPAHAALAVACPVGGDVVQMTNSPWRFSCAALKAELDVHSLQVLNDFEALALSLPRLDDAQLRWHRRAPRGLGTLAVVGPGTGLGVAGLVPSARGWLALPGEGGHATMCAADAFEARLLEHVMLTHAHVSAERLLSGIGLPTLHAAIAAVDGTGAPATAPDAAAIVERANAGDAACGRTLDVFCAMLGTFAGNVALTLGARGGLFIGGGIVPRIADRFFASRFRERFEAKGRMRAQLEAIPTALIVDTLAALTGAAAAIEQAIAPVP